MKRFVKLPPSVEGALTSPDTRPVSARSPSPAKGMCARTGRCPFPRDAASPSLLTPTIRQRGGSASIRAQPRATNVAGAQYDGLVEGALWGTALSCGHGSYRAHSTKLDDPAETIAPTRSRALVRRQTWCSLGPLGSVSDQSRSGRATSQRGCAPSAAPGRRPPHVSRGAERSRASRLEAPRSQDAGIARRATPPGPVTIGSVDGRRKIVPRRCCSPELYSRGTNPR
jgi:hypothetical protein